MPPFPAHVDTHKTLPIGAGRRSAWRRLLLMALAWGAIPAHAIPPPPPRPHQLREATMTVTVQLIEASKGTVTRIRELCKVSGKIPVFSDDGRSYFAHTRDIAGCRLAWNGRTLSVAVHGAKAVSRKKVSFARAYVGVTPPGAPPACPQVCGPQPLADSSAEIRVSGNARSITFGLSPNPGSILRAKPTVWLEAEVTIVD